jgi:hypothetical protein
VGAKLFHADGRTDGNNDVNNRFSQFCEKRLNSKLALIHAIKAYRGNGGIYPLILDLWSRRKWLVSVTPWPLYLRYPLNRRLGGPQSRFWRFGDEITLLLLPGLQPRIVQPVAWSLHRLSHRGSTQSTAKINSGGVTDWRWTINVQEAL